MNILFDQTEAQALFFNGAAEYAQTVFFKMVNELESYPQVRLYSLYSSERDFRYKSLSPDSLHGIDRVQSVDYKGKTLRHIVEENEIDLLFITCVQAFCDLPLGDLRHLPCRVVCVIHDLYEEEMDNSKVFSSECFFFQPLTYIRYRVSRLRTRLFSGSMRSRTKAMVDMLNTNNALIVTVSEYSKHSLEYIYQKLSNKIVVYASPEKKSEDITSIENETLRDLVQGGRQYYLLLSADRPLKNARRMLNAFRRFAQKHPSAIIATIGYGRSLYKNHVSLPFLSSSDLNNAYRNCHALLYPSLFEGFGYPPIEAMKFGKPVLCSNVCSMPEVLGDAPIYFSPVYETDIYKALCLFAASSYDQLCQRSRIGYERIKQKQDADLHSLVSGLLSGNL